MKPIEKMSYSELKQEARARKVIKIGQSTTGMKTAVEKHREENPDFDLAAAIAALPQQQAKPQPVKPEKSKEEKTEESQTEKKEEMKKSGKAAKKSAAKKASKPAKKAAKKSAAKKPAVKKERKAGSIDEIVELLKKKLTPVEIVKKGYSRSTIYHAQVKLGLKTRPAKKSKK